RVFRCFGTDGQCDLGYSPKKRAARWNTSRGSPNRSDQLRYTERGERRLIDCSCHRQSVVGLERCDSLLGHLPKYPIDWSIVITVTLQLRLHIDSDLVRGQSIVGADWAIVCIISIRVITPCREPIACIPVIPAAAHKDDPI